MDPISIPLSRLTCPMCDGSFKNKEEYESHYMKYHVIRDEDKNRLGKYYMTVNGKYGPDKIIYILSISAYQIFGGYWYNSAGITHDTRIYINERYIEIPNYVAVRFIKKWQQRQIDRVIQEHMQEQYRDLKIMGLEGISENKPIEEARS